MRRTQLKMLFRLVLMGVVGVFGILALGVVSRAMADITRSEETAAIFNVAAELDPELVDAVEWLPDPEGLPKQLPPLVREDITDTWLRAWAQMLILSDGRGQVDGSLDRAVTDGIGEYFDGSAAEAMLAGAADRLGLPVHQIGHDLRLQFYSDDGSVLSLRSESSRFLRATPTTDGGFEWYESDEQYEAVFVLENGNWRIRHWRRIAATGTWSSAAGTDSPVPLATDNLRSVTWRPSSQSIEQFLVDPDLDTARADLTLAGELGFDTIRIEVPFHALGGRSTTDEDLAPIAAVLDLAHAADLDVVIALLHGRTEHQPWHWDADDDHLRTVVATLADHPSLIMWELANGPDLAIGVERIDQAMLHAWLGHIHRTLRSLDTTTPVTIGWSSPAAALAGPPLGDVVSFAWTGDRAMLDADIAELRRLADRRPLVIADARQHTHLGLLPGGLNESEQTVYFADMLHAVADLGLTGFNVTMLRDLDVARVATTAQVEAEDRAAAASASQAALDRQYPAAPTPEAREPGPEVHTAPIVADVTWPVGAEAETGLVRADGSRKPAADLFAPGADLGAVAGPGLIEQLTKPFNLVLIVLVAGGLGGWLFLAFWARNPLPRPHVVGRIADGLRAARVPHVRRTPRSVMTAPTDELETESNRGLFRRAIDWLNAPVLPEADAEVDAANDGAADESTMAEPHVPAATNQEPQPAPAATASTSTASAPSPASTFARQAAGEQAAAQQAAAIAELVAQRRAVEAELAATEQLLARQQAALRSSLAPQTIAPQPAGAVPTTLADALPAWPADEMDYGQVHHAMFGQTGDSTAIVMVEIDLHHIEQAIGDSRRELPPSGSMRYAPFLLRAMCIADADGDPKESPLHVLVTSPAGDTQVVADAQDQRLAAFARRLVFDGSSPIDIETTVALRLVDTDSGPMTMPVSDSPKPLVTLVHLGARPHVGADARGNAAITMHPIALLSVQATAPPNEAGDWLTRLRDLLEQRDWSTELD